jgi:hypothetical protein
VRQRAKRAPRTRSQRRSLSRKEHGYWRRLPNAIAGIFVDYLGISQTNTDNFGLGGRFGYRIHRRIMLEGELAYAYGLNFNEAFRDVTNGNIAAIQCTSIGVTHGLFGPKLQPARERGFHPSLPQRPDSWIFG